MKYSSAIEVGAVLHNMKHLKQFYAKCIIKGLLEPAHSVHVYVRNGQFAWQGTVQTKVQSGTKLSILS